MTTYRTREIPIPSIGCVPTYCDTWGSNKRDRWMNYRRYSFMPWNDHVVAEGIVEHDDYNLKRAIRDNSVDVEV